MSDAATQEHTDRGPLSTDELAAVIGRDIPAGSYVNLGIGQPTKIADYLPTDEDGSQTVVLVGSLDPEAVVTPSIYVDRVVPVEARRYTVQGAR